MFLTAFFFIKFVPSLYTGTHHIEKAFDDSNTSQKHSTKLDANGEERLGLVTEDTTSNNSASSLHRNLEDSATSKKHSKNDGKDSEDEYGPMLPPSVADPSGGRSSESKGNEGHRRHSGNDRWHEYDVKHRDYEERHSRSHHSSRDMSRTHGDEGHRSKSSRDGSRTHVESHRSRSSKGGSSRHRSKGRSDSEQEIDGDRDMRHSRKKSVKDKDRHKEKPGEKERSKHKHKKEKKVCTFYF